MREDKSTEPKLYSVSEAVQQCGVPSHVLRYWEEELDLPIQRTAQGHRIYSEENLVTFRRVKELKNKGIQLKAIRLVLNETEDGRVLEHFFEQGDRVPEVAMSGETALREEEATQTADRNLAYGESAEIADRNLAYGEATETADRIQAYGKSTEVIGTISWRDGEADARKEPDAPNRWRSNEKAMEESGKPEKSEEMKATDTWNSQETEYEIIPSSEATNYQRFESMLRSLVSEAVAEQNEKLEQALTELIRDEIEDLYIQLCQDEGRREAAAADERNQERRGADGKTSSGRIRELLKKVSKSLFRA